VIALHQGLKPLSETVNLLRDLLPEPTATRISPAAVDTEDAVAIPAWGGEAKSQSDFAVLSGETQFKP